MLKVKNFFRCFGITVIIIVCSLVVPMPVNASGWEDQLDEAWQTGFDAGYNVGWADAECAMEYGDNGYSSSNSYVPDELDQAYDDGYSHGYDTGYEKGVEAGIKQKENGETSWIVYAVGVAVLYGIYKFGECFGEEKSSKIIGRLHAENMELHRILNKQEDAV